MIILDTNVVSEMVRQLPDIEVMTWLNRQSWESIFITAVTKGEIIYGMESMPRGRRAAELREAYGQLFETRFFNRVLPFDQDAAEPFGRFAAVAQKRGRELNVADLQIAAIAAANQAAVATRNTNDFNFLDLTIINPWTD